MKKSDNPLWNMLVPQLFEPQKPAMQEVMTQLNSSKSRHSKGLRSERSKLSLGERVGKGSRHQNDDMYNDWLL
jgi:hypothetical protein